MTNEELGQEAWDRFRNGPKPVEVEFGVGDAAVLLLLLIVVWNAGRISKLCFQNVALYVKPRRYRLEGKETLATLQACIALVCIFVPWLLYVTSFPLLDGLLITRESLFSEKSELDAAYFALIGSLLAFLFLWPLLFALSRFITLWCNAYGRSEQLEKSLILGSTWLLMGGVLYSYSVREVSPAVSQGYSVAIIGSGLLGFLLFPWESQETAVTTAAFVGPVHVVRAMLHGHLIDQPFLWLSLLFACPFACSFIYRATEDKALTAFRQLGKPIRRRPPQPKPTPVYVSKKSED